MGKKTDKKIKPDRINVLKKQYDMFLEEDKKRKDRNDYILGRLEKMRYSSTAIQLRQTPGDYFSPLYNRHTYRLEKAERNDMQMIPVNQQISRPGYQSLQLDVQRNYLDETSILKEISKKYILIPKIRTSFPNDGLEAIPPLVPAMVPSVKPDDIDNNDWKSKYDILEQLKKKEKEEINKPANENVINYEPIRKNNIDGVNVNDHVTQNYKQEDLPSRYEEEIPVKDLPDQIAVELKNLDKYKPNEMNDQIPSIDATHVNSTLFSNSENAVPYYDQNINEAKVNKRALEVNENLEHNSQTEQYVTPAEQNIEFVSHSDNTVENQENYSEQEFPQEYPIEYEQLIPNTEADTSHTEQDKVISQEENDYIPIEVINPNELLDEINTENVVQETIETDNEYLTEIANTEEFVPDEAVVMEYGKGANPENYVTDDGTVVQGNPVPQVSPENPPDNSGIDEFDAEQREMFYSEQSGQNYAHDQQDAGDAYNAGYSQNENYPQTQEYAYYEGAPQEEPTYPVEINEHEETQQLYDQNYEQQYATNYEQGYDQQAVYMEQDPTQSQFEQPALYDKAEELEQYTFDQQQPQSQEQVEQVLDREDGYTEKGVVDPIYTAPVQDEQNAELNVP